MKFFISHTSINNLTNWDDMAWLQTVHYSTVTKRISLDQWGNGWVCEADESFLSFYTILSGKELMRISETEYMQLISDKTIFLDKLQDVKILSCFQ